MTSVRLLSTCVAALAILGGGCSGDDGSGGGAESSGGGSTASSESGNSAGGSSGASSSSSPPSSQAGASGGSRSVAPSSSPPQGGNSGGAATSSVPRSGGGQTTPPKSSSAGAGGVGPSSTDFSSVPNSGGSSKTGGDTSASAGASGSAGASASGGSKIGGTTSASTPPGTAGSTGTPGDPHAPGNAPVKSSGCGKTPSLKNGTQTITSSNQQRQYIIDIPADYDNNKAYRLIFGLHWMNGTMTDVATGQTVKRNVWAYFGLKQLDTPRSAIFIAPQGIGNAWPNTNGQDTTLLDDIIKKVSDDLCIDTTRIFAGGFSYGGMFSSTLACTRTDVYRALAPQNGSATCPSPKKVAFISSGSNDGSKTSLLSYARGIAKANGCADPNENMPQPAAGSKSHVCTSFSGCPAAYPVRYCAFDANHKAAPCDGCGPEQDDGDKTWTPGEVWKFYTQF